MSNASLSYLLGSSLTWAALICFVVAAVSYVLRWKFGPESPNFGATSVGQDMCLLLAFVGRFGCALAGIFLMVFLLVNLGKRAEVLACMERQQYDAAEKVALESKHYDLFQDVVRKRMELREWALPEADAELKMSSEVCTEFLKTGKFLEKKYEIQGANFYYRRVGRTLDILAPILEYADKARDVLVGCAIMRACAEVAHESDKDKQQQKISTLALALRQEKQEDMALMLENFIRTKVLEEELKKAQSSKNSGTKEKAAEAAPVTQSPKQP